MFEKIDPKLLVFLAGSCGSLFGWLFRSAILARKAVARTDVEEAAADVAEAQKAVEAAALTPGLDDDDRAAVTLAAANQMLRAKKRLAAALEALPTPEI